MMPMKSMSETVPTTETGWKCFHCGVMCATHAEATGHFGPTETWKPTCQDRSSELELLARTRAAESGAHDFLGQRNDADEQSEIASAKLSELGRFKGAKSIYDAWCMFESMEGRALAAEAMMAAVARMAGEVAHRAREEVCGADPLEYIAVKIPTPVAA